MNNENCEKNYKEVWKEPRIKMSGRTQNRYISAVTPQAQTQQHVQATIYSLPPHMACTTSQLHPTGPWFQRRLEPTQTPFYCNILNVYPLQRNAILSVYVLLQLACHFQLFESNRMMHLVQIKTLVFVVYSQICDFKLMFIWSVPACTAYLGGVRNSHYHLNETDKQNHKLFSAQLLEQVRATAVHHERSNRLHICKLEHWVRNTK